MAVLGGLTPYSTYKVRVRAYKDNLYGDYSYTTVTAVLSPVTEDVYKRQGRRCKGS